VIREWRSGEYVVSTDRSRLDLGVVHGYLKWSYWAEGVPLDVVRRSVENSLVFGMYRDAEQVGFARVVTDQATFAYLADVFVLEEHRGQNLGKWLVETVLSHPELQDLRRWMLATRDARELSPDAAGGFGDECCAVFRQGALLLTLLDQANTKAVCAPLSSR
jgi:GNAT superfamily N-acetyltransferase